MESTSGVALVCAYVCVLSVECGVRVCWCVVAGGWARARAGWSQEADALPAQRRNNSNATQTHAAHKRAVARTNKSAQLVDA